MNRCMDWKAKLNICTVTNQTAGKTWERITNIYHTANEVQKILAESLKRDENIFKMRLLSASNVMFCLRHKDALAKWLEAG